MSDEDVLVLTKLSVTPNQCDLNQQINLALEFTLKAPVPNATWSITYEADYTNKRHALELYKSSPVDLAAGANTFAHTVATVDTSKVKEKYLLQVGLLRVVLLSGTDVVSNINMVTQVTKDAKGTLIRNIISPLE
eukprot:PhF_6_TR30833/c0_g1_i1/m.45383